MKVSVYVHLDSEETDEYSPFRKRISALQDHSDPDNLFDCIVFRGKEADVTVYLTEETVSELQSAVIALQTGEYDEPVVEYFVKEDE